MSELESAKLNPNDLKECDGNPEPSCFSSLGEFRCRALECLLRWRAILCC